MLAGERLGSFFPPDHPKAIARFSTLFGRVEPSLSGKSVTYGFRLGAVPRSSGPPDGRGWANVRDEGPDPKLTPIHDHPEAG
jgi:hypothetical protein